MPIPRDKATEIVYSTLQYALGIDREEISPNSRLKKDLGMESLDEIDILLKLEIAANMGRSRIFETRPTHEINMYERDERYSQEMMRLIKTDLSHFYNALPEDVRVKFEATRSPKLFADERNVQGLIDYVMAYAQQPTSA